jgi:hypothetical protein
VAQFSATDGAYLDSVHLGGDGHDYANAVAVDAHGDIVVVGTTSSTDFPLQNPLQTTRKGVVDFFVTKFRGDDLSVQFSTYLGGSENESAYGAGKVALDASGNLWMTGSTRSAGDFPLASPVQAGFGGATDAFVAKLVMGETVSIVRTSHTVTISWSASATGFNLEASDTLPSNSNWQPEPTVPEIVGDQNVVTLELGAGPRFFRLKKP